MRKTQTFATADLILASMHRLCRRWNTHYAAVKWGFSDSQI